MEVDDVKVELKLVEEVLLWAPDVELLLVPVLLEVVDDLEVEEMEVDDVVLELVLVEEVPALLLLVEVLGVEVGLGLDVDVPVELLRVLRDVVGRVQVVEDQPINWLKKKPKQQRKASKCHGMSCNGMEGHGMAWNGMEWYGMPQTWENNGRGGRCGHGRGGGRGGCCRGGCGGHARGCAAVSRKWRGARRSGSRWCGGRTDTGRLKCCC